MVDVLDALEEMLRERAMLHQGSILAQDVTLPSQQLKAVRRGVASLGIGLKAIAVWMRQQESPTLTTDTTAQPNSATST